MKSKRRSNPAGTSARFQAPFVSLAFLLLGILPAGALQPVTNAHFEITPEFTPATNQWAWYGYWIDENLLPQKTNLNEVYFPGLDAPSSNGGLRVTQPSTPQWAFTGATTGETFWRYRDNTLETPGMGANPSNMSLNAMTLTLHSVQSPADGFFSMYFSNTSPTPYFRTDNGVDSTDSFAKPLNHTHYNWAFTRKGLWIVNLTAQGILNSTGLPTPVSPPQPVVFAIGDHAMWKAARFSMAELQNAAVSGDSADPDGDGWNNLMEYAFGGNPLVSSALRADDGEPMAPRLLPPGSAGSPWSICYFRRTAAIDTELSYQIESSSSLGANEWTLETGIAGPPSSGGTWEMTTVPLPDAPEESSERFFRMRISPIP